MPDETQHPTASRSVQRRQSLERGEPIPTFHQLTATKPDAAVTPDDLFSDPDKLREWVGERRRHTIRKSHLLALDLIEKLAAERDSYKRIVREQDELMGRLDMAIGDAITAAGKGVYDRMTNDMERTADAPQVIRELAASMRLRRFGDEKPADGADVLLYFSLGGWAAGSYSLDEYPGLWKVDRWHQALPPSPDDWWLPMPALPAVTREGEK